MSVKIEPEWAEALHNFFEDEQFEKLTSFIKSEYLSKKIFPKPENIFKAFWLTPFSKVKVVILGQDPYHDDGQAHGLCFSVPNGVPIPPSLQNIYKENELEESATTEESSVVQMEGNRQVQVRCRRQLRHWPFAQPGVK